MKIGLQIALGIFSIIPLYFAVIGVMHGIGDLSGAAEPVAAIDNQYRYLSGTYVLVTLLLWYVIPSVERHAGLLRLIVAALVIGGIGRFLSASALGPGLDYQMSGMLTELGSPVFLLWQYLVSRAAKTSPE